LRCAHRPPRHSHRIERLRSKPEIDVHPLCCQLDHGASVFRHPGSECGSRPPEPWIQPRRARVSGAGPMLGRCRSIHDDRRMNRPALRREDVPGLPQQTIARLGCRGGQPNWPTRTTAPVRRHLGPDGPETEVALVEQWRGIPYGGRSSPAFATHWRRWVRVGAVCPPTAQRRPRQRGRGRRSSGATCRMEPAWAHCRVAGGSPSAATILTCGTRPVSDRCSQAVSRPWPHFPQLRLDFRLFHATVANTGISAPRRGTEDRGGLLDGVNDAGLPCP